jgi:hypothetical protein
MRKFTFSFKSLLVAAGLLLGSANAWAADTSGKVIDGSTVTETFDFSGWGLINLNSKTAATIGKASETADHTIGATAVYEVTNPVGTATSATLELYNRFAMSNPGTDRANYQVLFYNSDSKGKRAYFGGTAKSGYLSILDLPENAEITFEVEGTITFQSSNVKVKNSDAVTPGTTTITGGTTYVVTTAGDVDFSHTTWSGFKKVVITYEVDEELVSVPTIAVAYNGANRTVTITSGTSSKSNPVTTYYTTDGSTPTSSSSVYSSALDISSNCTVKAVTISDKGTSSDPASEEVTVGKLTLNAPTFTKTAYSEGNYTVTIANDQSSLEYVPASTTIKYRVGTTGDFAEYSTGVSVPEGSTLYAYVEATNYTNSSTAECATTARTGMYQVWTQDYTQVSKAAGTGTQQINLHSSVDFTVGTRNFYNIVSYGTTPTAVEVTTNVGLNTSSYFYFRCNGSSSGILKNSDSGGSAGYLGIRNLIPGQIIKISVNSTNLSAEAGAVLLEDLSTSKDYFFKASSTAASIYFPKGTYNYVYDVTVYNTKDIYNSLKTYATALADVANDNSAANSTLASVITAQNAAVESATTGAEISTALTTLRTAMDTYASVANPTTGNKFDLSYMLLNPNLENIKDWEAAEVYGWKTDYADNNFAVRTNLNSGKDGVERWRASAYTTPNTFAIYQEVTLPEGNYSFEAEALANQTSTMVMAAGDTEGDAITSSDFAAYSVDFTQASESEVKVGIKISSEGTNTCNWTGITSPRLYKEPASSVSATIGATGYTTFASPYALNLSGMTASEGEVTAFYASASNASSVTMTSKTATVAAGEGLLLKGSVGATITIPVVASGDAISGNKLVGCTTETPLSANANYWVLVNNGGAEFQSLAEKGATIPAGKAYLDLTADPGVKALGIVFAGDTATGVEAPEVTEAEEDGIYYNLNGQQVTKDYKGIVIVNGKKFLNK